MGRLDGEVFWPNVPEYEHQAGYELLVPTRRREHESQRNWAALPRFWIQFRGIFRRILVVKLISKRIELKSLKTRY